MGKVIAIANQKGGIGKTTTAVAIATILQSLNKQTLLIDTDMQCNSTDVYGAKTEDVATLYDLIVEKEPIDIHETIQKTPSGDIIAADRLLVNADIEIQKDPVNGIYRLQEAIEDIKEQYDYIIIDTNPTVNQLLFNCLVASDSVVIPVTADRFGMVGLSQIIDTINNVKKRPNKALTIDGILIVKYHANANLEKDVKNSIEEVAKSLGANVFKTTIRESVKIREAQALHTSLISYAPKNNGTLDYVQFVHELIGE